MSENASAETTTASTAEIRGRAADALGVPQDQIEVGDPLALSPSTCSIVAAWDAESTNPYPSQWAALPDGSIVAGGSDQAAQQAIGACFIEPGLPLEPTSVAQAVVLLGERSGPTVLLESGSATRALEQAGYEVIPPEATDGGDGETVTFLVENRETGVVGRMTATITTDGELTTAYEKLA